MYKKSCLLLCTVAVIAGCAGKNPVDRVTYRHEPLVKQVEDGMTKQQVLTLGGPPSSEVKRTAHPGTCNNYVLNHEGHEQTYYVSFDAEGRVESKGFTTCEAKDKEQNKLRL